MISAIFEALTPRAKVALILLARILLPYGAKASAP